MLIRGRCLAITPSGAVVGNEREVVQVTIRSGGVSQGDIIQVETESGVARVLTPARTSEAGATQRRLLDPRRRHAVAVRGRVEAAIRGFFTGRGFHEVRTPAVVVCPGLEPHLRPFQVPGAGFLHTSPELAMKRLLVGGLEKIFQICPVWRDEPAAPTHRPEFTMLEWYRAYARDTDIMADTEELVAHVATETLGLPSVRFAGREISLAPPWPRLRVRDLFQEHAGVDLVGDDLRAACARLGLRTDEADTWDDLYFRIWLDRIEPRLPADRAVLVTRYPASQAALAVVDEDPDGSRWARRFEVYAGGLELGNAFEELTDPVEQRRRFQADIALRAALHPEDPPVPLDEGFLAALSEGMPPAGGIAVGVDRLVMLVAGEEDIGYTTWL
jgi:elongation factor P--(R)-beta-lysine ligase